jgi:hypothetical protein
MDFEVNYNTWRYAGMKRDEHGATCLLNTKGMSCCLGHCALNMGVEPHELEGISEPGSLGSLSYQDNDQEPLSDEALAYMKVFCGANADVERNYRYNNDLTLNAMRINDQERYTLADRMNKLTELFKMYGHTLTFKNVPEDLVDVMVPLP